MFQKLIDDLAAVDDPTRRGALATEALEAIKDANARIAEIRQDAARELKDQGFTLAEIGERIGSRGRPLHFTRIAQILRGGPTGRWARIAQQQAIKDTQSSE